MDDILLALLDYILNVPGAYIRYLVYGKKRQLSDLKKDYVINSTVVILVVFGLGGLVSVLAK